MKKKNKKQKPVAPDPDTQAKMLLEMMEKAKAETQSREDLGWDPRYDEDMAIIRQFLAEKEAKTDQEDRPGETKAKNKARMKDETLEDMFLKVLPHDPEAQAEFLSGMMGAFGMESKKVYLDGPSPSDVSIAEIVKKIGDETQTLWDRYEEEAREAQRRKR